MASDSSAVGLANSREPLLLFFLLIKKISGNRAEGSVGEKPARVGKAVGKPLGKLKAFPRFVHQSLSTYPVGCRLVRRIRPHSLSPHFFTKSTRWLAATEPTIQSICCS